MSSNDVKETAQPRKIGFWVYFIFVTGLIITLGWFFCYREVALRVSPETTHITEPLDATGRRVDYLAAMEQLTYPPEMKTDENGYRIIFRALGAGYGDPVPEKDGEYYEKLGLDPVADQPTLRYQSPRTFFEQRFQSHPEELEAFAEKINEKAMWETWQQLLVDPEFLNSPFFRQWLDGNQAALDLVAEAVQKPVFAAPLIMNDEDYALAFELFGDISPLQILWDHVEGFITSARYRLVRGETEQAVEDLLAIVRLAGHLENQPRTYDLLGVGFESRFNGMPFLVHATERLSAEQLRRLLAAVDGLPPLDDALVKKQLEMERLFVLNIADWLMSRPDIDDWKQIKTLEIADELIPLGVDWNRVFKRINTAFDEVLAGTYSNPVLRDDLPGKLTVQTRSDRLAEYIYGLRVPYQKTTESVYTMRRCSRNLKRIVLAMHIYEREHGTLPPTFLVDENGQTLHGWRTLLLPYFGDEKLTELYSQIRLDEPWDSEHNRRFHATNVDVYRCPAASLNDGESSYTVLVGENSRFTDDGKGQPLDAAAEPTVILVDRQTGTCWMQPDAEMTQEDFEKEKATGHSACAPGANRFNVAYDDGTVDFWMAR